MGTINSFTWTEPVSGIEFTSYESGGVHTQVVVIGDTDGAALPLDATYGLSVDIKRLASGSSINSYITDPEDDTLQAVVLDSLPDGTEMGLGVRMIGTVAVEDDDTSDLRTLAARIVWLLETYMELDSSGITPEDVGV